MYLEAGLENIYCVFDIPFHLGIPDTLPTASDVGPTDEIFVASDVPMGLSTCRIANLNSAIVVPGEIEAGDLYGRLNRTRIQIRFNRNAAPKFADWNDDAVLDRAVEGANRLISAYRDVYARPLFVNLSVPDIVHFSIVFEFDDGRQPFTRQIAKPRGPATFGFDEQSILKFEELRRRLQLDVDVNFLRMLELETNRHALMKDFRLAVISSATLFEAWLTRLLEERMAFAQMKPREIARQFEDSNGIPRSISWVARELIPKFCGFDFVNSTVGLRWAADCRDLRNRVVHGKLEVVSEQAARNAVQAAYDANAFIKSRLR